MELETRACCPCVRARVYTVYLSACLPVCLSVLPSVRAPDCLSVRAHAHRQLKRNSVFMDRSIHSYTH